MSNINVNRNVYDAVKAATYDGWTTSPKVSEGELQTIEQEIAKDGEVDAGERQLLDALSNKTDFTVDTA